MSTPAEVRQGYVDAILANAGEIQQKLTHTATGFADFTTPLNGIRQAVAALSEMAASDADAHADLLTARSALSRSEATIASLTEQVQARDADTARLSGKVAELAAANADLTAKIAASAEAAKVAEPTPDAPTAEKP